MYGVERKLYTIEIAEARWSEMTGAFFRVDCVLTVSSGMDSERIFTLICRKYRNNQNNNENICQKIDKSGCYEL